ncbi:MAG: phage tail protein I [Gammaproteobacteria bacterium]|nr:MAG: phage tail protein I [Gammaproteobacteria bacterium]UTW43796.1 phage tail protein I [bacterium SCSIO 12844]
MNSLMILPPNATKLEQSIVAAFLNQLAQKEIFIRSLFNPDEALDVFLVYLAQLLSVDFELYHQVLEPKKCLMIKQSIEIHRQKGTFGALKNALDTLGYPISINEWYESDDLKAHTFSLTIDLTNHDHVNLEVVNHMVKKHKNIQSSYCLKLNNNLNLAIFIFASFSIEHTFLLQGD